MPWLTKRWQRKTYSLSLRGKRDFPSFLTDISGGSHGWEPPEFLFFFLCEKLIDKGGILMYIYICQNPRIFAKIQKETGEDNVQRTHQTPGSRYGVRRGADT
jgi:hypothetical protein